MIKVHPQKIVALAAALSLLLYALISISDLTAYSNGVSELPQVVTTETSSIENDPTKRKKELLRKRKMMRGAETLNTLAETEDIWLRRSPMQHAALREEVS